MIDDIFLRSCSSLVDLGWSGLFRECGYEVSSVRLYLDEALCGYRSTHFYEELKGLHDILFCSLSDVPLYLSSSLPGVSVLAGYRLVCGV